MAKPKEVIVEDIQALCGTIKSRASKLYSAATLRSVVESLKRIETESLPPLRLYVDLSVDTTGGNGLSMQRPMGFRDFLKSQEEFPDSVFLLKGSRSFPIVKRRKV